MSRVAAANKKCRSFTGFNKSLIAIAVMSLTHSSFAQESGEPAQEEEVEVINVKGMRANLLSAQALKRDAATFVDGITAEDIGALPDRSVLEAIQRLPGVSVERFAGPDDPDHFSVEGSGAIIRGLTQTRSEFNGRDSFTANSGRGLSFQDVSPELMGGVDVYKNQTADMIEGGIGGTVSLRTRRPFDSDKRILAFTADYSYGDLAEKGSPTFSALYSDSFDTDTGKFGVLFNVARSQLYGTSHGIQADTFVPYLASNIAGADDFVGLDGLGTVYIPQASNIRTMDNDRQRKGFSTALQFENVDETLLATFQYIRSDATLSWHENAIKYNGGFRSPSDGRSRPLSGTEFSFDEQGLFESGIITQGVDGWRTSDPNVDHVSRGWGDNATSQFGSLHTFESRARTNRNLVEDFSLNLRYKATDSLTVTGDVQHVKAETSDDDIVLMNGAWTIQAFDLTGSIPTVGFIDPWNGGRDANPDAYATHPSDAFDIYPGFSDDPAGDSNYFQDPNSYFSRSIMDHYERSDGDSTAARLDFQYYLEDGGIVTDMQFGVRYAKREQTVRNSAYNWGSTAPEFSGSARAGWLPEIPGYENNYHQVDWSDFYRGGDIADIPGGSTIHPTEEYVRSFLGTGAIPFKSGAGEWFPMGQRRDPSTGGSPNERSPYEFDDEYGLFLPSEVFTTTEKNKALYLRLNFEGNDDVRYSGNVGFRYVILDRDALGAVQFPNLIPNFAAPEGVSLPLTPDAVLAYVNQQVADGTFPDISTALRDPSNQWTTGANNYLSDTVRSYGNNQTEQSIASSQYKMFLPSLNVKVEVTDELIARFGISKAVALPDMGDVRNNLSLGVESVESVRPLGNDAGEDVAPEDNLIQSAYVTAFTGGGGNPYLKPITAVQYDVSLEWYFADVGQLSATLFHKNLKDFWVQGATPIAITNPSSGITQTSLVTTTVNGGTATVDGLEVAYQQFFDMLPEPFNGFGVQATYTLVEAGGVPNNQIDYEDESWAGSGEDPGLRVDLGTLPLQGQSKHTANFIAMYEKDDWSARLAYNWRSKYLLTTRDVISKVPLFYDDYGQLDGSVFYNINDSVTVGIQGTNLTKTDTKTIMVLDNEGTEAGRSWFTSDRRVALVVRGNF
jgi:iron complex outermembrane recepter protein